MMSWEAMAEKSLLESSGTAWTIKLGISKTTINISAESIPQLKLAD